MFSRINMRLARALTGVLLVAATLLGSRQPAMAQGSVVTITGVVKGTNGAILAGALVSATGSDAGTRSTSTREDGKYMLFFPNGGAAFRVTVKATGYLLWSGDVKKAYNDDRIVADVALRAGGTAADWPGPRPASPAVTIERNQLGSADAVTVTIDSGEVLVRGTSSDRIVYHTYLGSFTPGPNDTIITLPKEIAPPTASYGLSSAGLTIGPTGNSTLSIAVPRSLAVLRIKVIGHGNVVVRDFDGQVSIQSAAGNVQVSAISGPTLIEARNGTITASVGVIPSTMNFLGHNGTVAVTLPADARATVAAEAHRGSIYHDSTSHIVTPPRFSVPKPADLQAYLEAHRVGMPGPLPDSKSSWVMGGGGAAITVTSLNGDIIIRRTPPKQD
jgi:hypothetical protein